MFARMYNIFTAVSRWSSAIAFGLVLIFLFSTQAWCESNGQSGMREIIRARRHSDVSPLIQPAGKGRLHKRDGYKKMPPEEKAMLGEKARKWKSLSSDKQNVLRQRMNKFNKLSPEERTLYRKRFEQFQKLAPDERNSIRRKLKKMDRLLPREKEAIRRKFQRQQLHKEKAEAR